jgi:multiple sugar transport system ATP-binding protein
MVFQNYALYPHMTVYRNMAFGLELRYGGLLRRIWKRLTASDEATALAAKRRQIPDRVRQTARLLGIEQLLQRLPRQLSGGERQRVALGRAIVREPSAFLFDEPLSNLDARLRVEMRRELKQLHRRLEATMIYVTHDQVEAMTLGQRIVVMDGGRIMQVGPPMEVYQRPRNRFVAGFLGSPPMNFIAGRLSQDGGAPRFRGGGLEVELPRRLPPDAPREVLLGVRPEDVRPVMMDGGQRDGTVVDGVGTVSVGTVGSVEPLGDQAVVHVDLKSNSNEGGPDDSQTTVTCKTLAREAPAVGDAVRLEIDAARAHVFSAAGENLAWRD